MSLTESELIRLIVERIAAVTERPAASFDIEQPFMNMGIESLQAVTIVSALSTRLELELAPTIMFDHPTISALAQHLADAGEVTTPTPVQQERRATSRGAEPIAVVGLACRFPGAANAEQFWLNLQRGIDSITACPESRPNLQSERAPNWGGFLLDVDRFDHQAFSISPAEAEHMDPQQRLLMETAWEAIEDSGRAPSMLRKSRTGVFIGISSNDYSLLGSASEADLGIYDATGNAHSIAANRISYAFDFLGPSVAVDTACSSSLVALHLACTGLRNHEIDFALVGGVNLILDPSLSVAFAAAQMLSPDGRCKTFSDGANGYVRGEGVGVLLLRRVSDAFHGGDPMHALIRGSAVNQDGRSNGLTAPSGPAQEAAIRSALAQADFLPSTISYVEAHGTGTPLGDPIEFNALSRVFARPAGDPYICRIGSVKTNIGHLEAAAGIAGVIKTILALKNRWIPASLNFKKLNSRIGSVPSALVVEHKGGSWESEVPRRAGVSSFGFGGTNAHVVLEEVPLAPPRVPENVNAQSWQIALFSASGEASLKEMADTFEGSIAGLGLKEITMLTKATWVGRSDLAQRVAVYGQGSEDLAKALRQYAAGESSTRWLLGQKPRSAHHRLAFLYTGQGAQSPRMGMDLYSHFPVYRQAFDECCEGFSRFMERDLFAVIQGQSEDDLAALAQTDYGQAAMFSLGYSLTRLLSKDFGLVPAIVAGHSLGEITAACCSEALSLHEAIRLVVTRGQLMQSTPDGALVVVFSDLTKVTEILVQSGGELNIAAYNGPRNFVVSGSPSAITLLEEICRGSKPTAIRTVRLRAQRAFHSHMMDGILADFEAAAAQISYKTPKIPIVSSLYGEKLQTNYDAKYWATHLRQPTMFEKSVHALLKDGVTGFVEIGPHPVLLPMAQACMPSDVSAHWYSAQHRDRPGTESFFQMLSALLANDFHLPNPALDKPEEWRQTLSRLPKTRFQKSTHWLKHGARPNHPIPIAPMAPAASLAPLVAHAPLREDAVLIDLSKILGHLLQVDPQLVDSDQPIIDLGADSLLLLNAVQTINDKYRVAIPISEIFQEVSTLRKMAAYVVKHQPKEIVKTHVVPPVGMPAIIETLPPGPLRDLLQQQLHVMNLQLALFSGHSAQDLATANAEATVNSRPSGMLATPAAAEKKGVLGNFRGFHAAQTTDSSAGQNASYLKDFVERFAKKTAKTKAHTEKYRKVLADNRVSAGFRPDTKEIVYPLICRRAKGARFTDPDGNEYIDFSMGFGVNLFGHSPDFIEDAIKRQIDLGMAVGPQAELAGPVAELVSELTGHERVAFCNSGTEAVMTAIRLARAATKREKIVIFEGSYHGHFDGVLARPGSGQTLPVAAGITRGFVGDVLVLDYLSPEALSTIRTHAHELAAVLVEPVQSRFPEQQPAQFLKDLRTLTRSHGIALIIDEVITGFRIHTGGSQAHFGVKGDLATYGKILGGGLPIGAIAGNSKYLDAIDGGDWRFGDRSFPHAEMTFFAGTFSKHPLAMAAAEAVLLRLKTDGERILADLNSKTERLSADLNQFFAASEIDIKVNCFGSLFRFKAGINLDLFYYGLNHRGFYIWEGRNLFLSTAHTADDIERFAQAVKDTAHELMENGIFGKKKILASKINPDRFPLLPSQLRFHKIAGRPEKDWPAGHVCLAVKMKGELDWTRLRTSLQTVVDHYDSFRLRFSLSAGDQWFDGEKVPITLETHLINEVESPWVALESLLREFGTRSFDLANAQPARFMIAKIAEETSVFAGVFHHIALDGWSISQFIENVASVYSALEKNQSVTLPKTMDFQQFLQHPNRFGSEKKMQQADEFWCKTFEKTLANGQPEYVQWPRPDSDAQSLRGERIVFSIEYGLFTEIKKSARSLKVTPLMFMLRAFTELIAEISAEKTMTIAVPAANRDLGGADKMIGNCANLLPIQLEAEGSIPSLDSLTNLKSQMLVAYQYMMHPYLNLEAKVGSPVFNVSFNVEPASELPNFGDVTLFVHPFPVTASEFDLTVNLTDLEYFYHGEADFRTGIASAHEVIAWMDRLVVILKKMVEGFR